MLPRDTADQISAAGTFCTLYSPYVVPIYVVALFGNSWFLSPSRSICFTVNEVRKESIRMNSWIRPKAIAMIFKYVRPRFLHSFKKIQKRCELCSIANSARLWQQGITPTGTEGNGKTSVMIFHASLHVKVEPSSGSFLVFPMVVHHSFSAWRGEDLRCAAVHFKGMEPWQRLQDPSGWSTLRLLRSALQRQLKHEQC